MWPLPTTVLKQVNLGPVSGLLYIFLDLSLQASFGLNFTLW